MAVFSLTQSVDVSLGDTFDIFGSQILKSLSQNVKKKIDEIIKNINNALAEVHV